MTGRVNQIMLICSRNAKLMLLETDLNFLAPLRVMMANSAE